MGCDAFMVNDETSSWGEGLWDSVGFGVGGFMESFLFGAKFRMGT